MPAIEPYIIREHDGTSISAPPRVIGVALDKETADRLVAEWDVQTHWSSLSAQKAPILGNDQPARPDMSVVDKANARASLTHATESRDA